MQFQGASAKLPLSFHTLFMRDTELLDEKKNALSKGLGESL